MRLTADYHTHTLYSHGEGRIKDNIEAAIGQGLSEIAIADHGPKSQSIRRFGVKKAETLLEIKKKIDEYNEYYPEINILAAVEANIINLDGEIDVPVEVLKQLDKVLVGFHLFIRPGDWKSLWGIIVNNAIIGKLRFNNDKIRKMNTELMIKVMDNYEVDIITHPGYQVDIDTKVLATEAAKRNVALEINAKHGFLTEEFLKVAAQEGVKFSLGSDAHTPQQVGEVTPALELVQRLGIPPCSSYKCSIISK
ncbi:PHP domain-containing protein [Halanaerobacter jeridensis]|uniref:Hydrolase n=1 Tax=Halanaerobacter jeridensis TaxID=706427 RepID=A0A938XSQ3_9FIRM|nr:putative hydrolase [Halanaerobacter jeridensis]